ncbi:MAG: cation:proton antiporter [Archangium sp.]|nr:cation:proton antiporter [Archangium sp.]
MITPHDFLRALTVVLGVAAVTTVICQKLRLPVVLGYLVAGLIVGPYLPIPLVADTALVTALSELGVILVMFSLGLEFSLKQLVRVGPTASITAVIECGIMLITGFLVGKLLGWTTTESIFTGAIVAISSTTIIIKTFDEQGIAGKLRQLVVGVLIVEDLIAIVLLATLTAISTGGGLSALALASTLGKLAAFLAALLGVGLVVVPRAARAVVRLNRPETTLVASVGFCFAVAYLAQAFGYSVALGAFIAGSLIAESGEGKVIEHLVAPLKDLFSAIFFVSVGMLIDPSLVLQHWGAALVLTAVVIVGKVVNVTIGAFLTGGGTRTSIQAGMSLAQIGEFSFIIAGLGLSLGATGAFLFPVAAAASVITTMLTGVLVRASGPVASFVDRKLPRRVQTFTTLYSSWLEQLREAPSRANPAEGPRKYVRFMILDAALLTAVMAAAALSRRAELTREAPVWLVVAVTLMLALPLCVGIVRLSQRLAAELAETALPARSDNRVDLAAAPRRVLLVTLQAAMVLALGVPMVAIAQPLLPDVPVGLVLLGLLGVLAVAFWRSTGNLEGHVRAGVEVITEALMRNSRADGPNVAEPSLADVQQLLPGLGAPTMVALGPTSVAVGKTLADLNLRGVTGATVLAISRGERAHVPTATDVLQVDDRLALTGSREAISAAKRMLGTAA